jgi:UrcA family protein
MIARSLLFSLVAAAALYPASATAAPIVVEAVPTVKVAFADLDMGAEAGRKALSKRVAGAAKQVCGTPSARDVKAFTVSKRCRENALSSANSQIERLLTTRLASAAHNVEVGGTD